MLFEAGGGVRLWVAVKYKDADSPLEEMTFRHGERIFLAEPDMEFEVIVVSVGSNNENLSICCHVGKPLLKTPPDSSHNANFMYIMLSSISMGPSTFLKALQQGVRQAHVVITVVPRGITGMVWTCSLLVLLGKGTLGMRSLWWSFSRVWCGANINTLGWEACRMGAYCDHVFENLRVILTSKTDTFCMSMEYCSLCTHETNLFWAIYIELCRPNYVCTVDSSNSCTPASCAFAIQQIHQRQLLWREYIK